MALLFHNGSALVFGDPISPGAELAVDGAVAALDATTSGSISLDPVDVAGAVSSADAAASGSITTDEILQTQGGVSAGEATVDGNVAFLFDLEVAGSIVAENAETAGEIAMPLAVSGGVSAGLASTEGWIERPFITPNYKEITGTDIKYSRVTQGD